MRNRPLSRTAVVVLLALLAPVAAHGDDRDEVMHTVQTFFDAMAKLDADLARTVLVPEGRFHSVREENGETVTRSVTNEEFVAGWAKRSDTLLERMWEAEARIHGGIAMVWTPYDFHIDGKFSHCGIDIFTLVKSEGKWMISGGVYTVERTGCPESPLGSVAE